VKATFKVMPVIPKVVEVVPVGYFGTSVLKLRG